MGTYLIHPSHVLGLTIAGRDVTSFFYQLPLPVVVGLAVVALIGVVGILGRVKAILSGKGTAMDFITVVLIFMVAAIVFFLVAGRAIKGLNVM